MKDSEKTEQNVNAREIIANLLHALGLNAPSLAIATGIAYQRIFDLQRGRTKKFNPGVVNMICSAFPMVNKTYLYTGEGDVLLDKNSVGDVAVVENNAPATPDAVTRMLDKIINLSQQVADREQSIEDKRAQLLAYERELMNRELTIAQRELDFERRTAGLPQANIA